MNDDEERYEGEDNEQDMEDQAAEEELENESAAARLAPVRPSVATQAGRFTGGAIRSTGSALYGLGRAMVPAPSPDGESPKSDDPAADDLDDLFEGPQPEDNDMAIDHLVDVPEEEELDDLLDVEPEDIMGEAPPPRVRRTGKPYVPSRQYPLAGMGGMQG